MLVRRMLRMVMRIAIVAGVMALARALLGRLAGEPGVAVEPGQDIPMSLDRWPAVPQAAGSAER